MMKVYVVHDIRTERYTDDKYSKVYGAFTKKVDAEKLRDKMSASPGHWPWYADITEIEVDYAPVV